jgi:ankyrin repeat protein
MYACRNGDTATVDLLISEGADVELKGEVRPV